MVCTTENEDETDLQRHAEALAEAMWLHFSVLPREMRSNTERSGVCFYRKNVWQEKDDNLIIKC